MLTWFKRHLRIKLWILGKTYSYFCLIMWLDQWKKETTAYKGGASFLSIKFNCKHFRHNESLLTMGHSIVILRSLRLLVGASFVSSMSSGKKIVSLIVNVVGAFVSCSWKKKREKKSSNFLELFALLNPKTSFHGG